MGKVEECGGSLGFRRGGKGREGKERKGKGRVLEDRC